MSKWVNYVSVYMLKWFLFATIMGLGGGLAAVLLYDGISLVQSGIFWIPMWIAPCIGGLLVCMIYYFDRDAMGMGTNRYISSINLNAGRLKKRTFLSKMIATMTTLGFGGSGGVEGPMVMIGGSLANTVSKIPFLRKMINIEDRRIMTICGAAGAVGAIFRSPLGGGIFVVEVLYRSSLHYNELFPAILSSTIGYAVFSVISNGNPLFDIPSHAPNMWNIPFFLLAGVLAGLVALLFMHFFSYISGLFRRNRYIKWVRPAVGGLLVGMILIFVPEVSGIGISVIQELITGTNFNLGFLLVLLLAKILATSFTVGSDGSAGLVIPALFIGAVCGRIVAVFIAGAEVGFSASLVVAGMAASLASIANVPVAASVIIIEMVGLSLAVPVTIGSIVGYVIGHSQVIYDITNVHENEFEMAKSFRKKDRRFE